jgi:ABC-type multidrug transport system fused ATPase/permease subunit
MSPLRYGIKYLKKYRVKLTSAIIWSILFAIIPMQLPVITGTLIDGIDNSDLDRQQVQSIRGGLYSEDTVNSDDDKPVLFYGIIEVGTTPSKVISFALVSLIFVAIAYGFTSYLSISSRSIISRNFAFELQNVLMRKLEFLSLDIHTKYGAGDLLNRTMLDTHNIRPFVEATIIKSITNIVRIFYPILMLFVIDWSLGIIVSLILPVQFLIIRKFQSKINKESSRLRNDKARLTMLQKENLDGVETIQTSNAEMYALQKISDQIQKVEEAQVAIQKYYGSMMGFAWGLTALGVALGWSLGGLKVLSGDITLGQLVIFSGFVLFAYAPVRKLTRTVKDHHRGIVAMRHIQEIMETSSSIKETENPIDLKIKQGDITFQNVSFSFKNRTILDNISLNIKHNSLTVIIGRSGSGKSSILKLITRLYDPTEGRVLIDGVDIKKVSIQSLRSQIAVVPQIPVIFTGTIMENIRLANPNASDIEVKQACIDADALKFITKFRKGLNTIIGQRGVSLSIGEGQRIAIARALLKEAKILVLDEPSSAIDPESAASIMNTVHCLKKDMTIILVNHNPDAIAKADNTITVDNKKVVEVVEGGIIKEIKLESGSCIVQSQNKLNYILVPSSDKLDNERVVSNTSQNPTALNHIYLPDNKSDTNSSRELVSNTILNPVGKNYSVEKKQAPIFLDHKIIGRSVKQRRINVIILGQRIDPRLRILVIAGQHGDEKCGRLATERLIDYLLKTKCKEYPEMVIAILPDANPDGSHKNSRRTRAGIDMNRDHLRLSSHENRVLHSFIRSWKPNLIIDVHNYPSEREYLKEHNYAFCHDVLVDTPSNLAVHNKTDEKTLENLISNIQLDLKSSNYNCQRYVLINSEGRVRHSTHDIVDARNFLSLRYNALTIIVEGREPLPGNERNDTGHVSSAQYLALLSILNWARSNAFYLLENSSRLHHKRGDHIVIGSKFVSADRPFKMNFKNTATNKVEEVIFSNYDSYIKATTRIMLPSAYAVPSDMVRVLEILHNHGFVSHQSNSNKVYTTEKYHILSLRSPRGKDRHASDVELTVSYRDRNLDDYQILPINQEGGHSLALFLEPKSEYGLHRYNNLNLNIAINADYPILRII